MSFNICSAGDIMLGENTHHYGRGIPYQFVGNFHSLLHPDVLEIINSSQIFFANLECTFIPDEDRFAANFDRAIYAAPTSALSFFDVIKVPMVMNIANNHFGQHGKFAADYTINKLEKRGIFCIGKNSEPITINLNDYNLKCWGASLVNSKNDPEVCFEASPAHLVDKLIWPKKHYGDVWVFSLHWGKEYMTLPAIWQEELAKELVSSGIDIILGHHPHVIQPVKRIRKSIVCFSHGNFVFDQNFSRITQEGLMCIICPDNADYLTYMTKQNKYKVYLKQTVKEWLYPYCKKNYSKYIDFKMRIAMKIELVKNLKHLNLETLQYFGKRIKYKFLNKS